MKFRKIGRACAVIVCAVVIPASGVLAADTQDPGVIAAFEGRQIDLSEGWGDAHACVATPDGARCYRTEREMDAAERAQPEQAVATGGVTALTACSSSVRLYDGTSYTGNVLQLTTRGVYHNLASFGFDNLTSSYKIGACSARFYDTTSGSTQYPGSTTANASATSMLSGWNNRVGSVYIL
jgi:hypothetical protein